jgi:peptidoglycan hydrolase FlgJ
MKIDGKIPQPAELKVETPNKPPEDPALRKVARQYEALFLNQLVSAMRKTVQKGGFVPESNAQKVYQSMLDSEHAEQMAQTDQIGLSNMLYEHLLQQGKNR